MATAYPPRKRTLSFSKKLNQKPIPLTVLKFLASALWLPRLKEIKTKIQPTLNVLKIRSPPHKRMQQGNTLLIVPIPSPLNL